MRWAGKKRQRGDRDVLCSGTGSGSLADESDPGPYLGGVARCGYD